MRFELHSFDSDNVMSVEFFDTLDGAVEYCVDRGITVGFIIDTVEKTSTPVSECY